LQVVNSAFLRALEALSVLLKKVFLITMPALPPALSILIKCCKNKLAVSPVFMGKFCFDYLNQPNLSTNQILLLQKNTFYGKEKKSLAYIIGIMNMILHGVEAPNIIHTNTLAENLADIQEKDPPKIFFLCRKRYFFVTRGFD
jgi:hypothetical protein